MFDKLQDLTPGVDSFPAHYIPIIREGLERDVFGVGVTSFPGGWNTTRTRRVQFRWGKLDGDLAAGNYQTVSLWCGATGHWSEWSKDSELNWEKCYAPPSMASGTIPSGSWVLVAIINGRKVVLNAWTVVTVMTNFRVDAANKKLQMKTRSVLVTAAGAESDWTDIHTGTACP